MTPLELAVQVEEAKIADPNSPDTAVAFAYKHLAEILYVDNIDTIIPLCTKAKQVATEGLSKVETAEERIYLRELIAGCYNNIGYAYMYKGEQDLAIENYEAGLAIQIEINDHAGTAISLNNLGQLQDRKGNLSMALDYYKESVEIQRRIGDKHGAAISLNNIAIIYKKQGNTDQALEYYELSYALREELGEERQMAGTLNNIGTLFASIDNYSEALQYYEESQEIYERLEYKRGIGQTLHNEGGIYIKQGKYNEALRCFERSYQLRQEDGLTDRIAESQIDLAKAYHAKGEYSTALSFALQGFETNRELGYPEPIKESAKILSQIYNRMGRGTEAYEMLLLSKAMEDSLDDDELQRSIVTSEAQLTYEKQKAIDQAEHEKEILVHKEEKQKQEIVTYYTIGGLILLFAFLAFVFNRLRVTRKQRNEIRNQKVEIEHKNKEIMDSITYAKRIQSAILPTDDKIKTALKDVFVLYKPKDIVAGDFYWLEQKDNVVLFAAADCTGHGVPGAMVSVVCNNGLNRSVREYDLMDPGKILDKTREIVVQEFDENSGDVKDGMDIALCSIEGNKLKYAGAHNPLWIIRNNELLETKADKQPIGKFSHSTPYTTHEVELQKGDLIYIFSDGYADQFGGESGKKYRVSRFKNFLMKIHQMPLTEQKQALDKEFYAWKGSYDQLDDICVIGMKY